MREIILTAYFVLVLLTIILFTRYRKNKKAFEYAEQQSRDLARFIRQTETHEEWKYWRSKVGEFLDYCEDNLPAQYYDEYREFLDKVLSDRLAFILHIK